MYVFTTRADTIMGVTFCAVAPSIRWRCTQATRHNPALAGFALRNAKKAAPPVAELALKEKEGQPHRPFITHPKFGAQVEVWVGNYVLMSYGDGAVMGVPAHDERATLPLPKVQPAHPAGGNTWRWTARRSLAPTPGKPGTATNKSASA